MLKIGCSNATFSASKITSVCVNNHYDSWKRNMHKISLYIRYEYERKVLD